MLKILGWLFIIAGLLLCFTIILIPWGVPAIGLGALLIIAGALSSRRRASEQP